MSELVKRLRTREPSLVTQSFVMAEAADRIEELERGLSHAEIDADIARQDWARLAGKIDALQDRTPSIIAIPAGYHGIYCRSYDYQKGWPEGTALNIAEPALTSEPQKA